MKAAMIDRTGGPDVLRIGQIDEPETGPDDIRIRVAAAAVNPVDLKTRSGFLPIGLSFPTVLGWDVAGVISETGSSVTGFAPGDRVVGMIAQPVRGHGTYAESVTAPASLFAPAPTGIPLTDSAALPLAGLTALQLLDKLALPDGSAVLVTGAAGAVGRIVVQLLRSGGHDVDGLARASDAGELPLLGAGRMFTTVAGLPEASYAAVVDTAGIAASIRSVRDGGRFIAIDDNEQPAATRGITPRKSYVAESGEQLAVLTAAVSDKQLDVAVGRRYPLEEAATAHKDFGAGGMRGKVLLIP
ncbi:NADP-dependent oxidoreductase [Nocardia sp. CNY236]|uniref:NADP-dependent oxidoreductase n=1 Tax=Nocardia sp. CNY236 TaxID=1169152 RepID=UPI000407643B|nr:NADP-dependent oxidoreductase [Nocardia sp. CNY236]